MDQRFEKHRRVLRGRDFDRAIRSGRCVADRVLVLYAVAAESPDVPARLGVTIPRRTGSAVVRNRWKRLIREAFRTQRPRIPVGHLYIVRPKKGADPQWEAIRRSLPALARRATASRSAKPKSRSEKRTHGAKPTGRVGREGSSG